MQLQKFNVTRLRLNGYAVHKEAVVNSKDVSSIEYTAATRRMNTKITNTILPNIHINYGGKQMPYGRTRKIFKPCFVYNSCA